MRRASIPAVTRVFRRLGIDARFVGFRHVYRLGPLAGDDASQWQVRRTTEGRVQRVMAAGAPLLVHRQGHRTRTGPAAGC